MFNGCSLKEGLDFDESTFSGGIYSTTWQMSIDARTNSVTSVTSVTVAVIFNINNNNSEDDEFDQLNINWNCRGLSRRTKNTLRLVFFQTSRFFYKHMDQ